MHAIAWSTCSSSEHADHISDLTRAHRQIHYIRICFIKSLISSQFIMYRFPLTLPISEHTNRGTNFVCQYHVNGGRYKSQNLQAIGAQLTRMSPTDLPRLARLLP